MSATAGLAPTVGGMIMDSDMTPTPEPNPCSEHTDNGSSMVDLHPALSALTMATRTILQALWAATVKLD